MMLSWTLGQTPPTLDVDVMPCPLAGVN